MAILKLSFNTSDRNVPAQVYTSLVDIVRDYRVNKSVLIEETELRLHCIGQADVIAQLILDTSNLLDAYPIAYIGTV